MAAGACMSVWSPCSRSIAAVPTVLVAIFASVLFQSGLEFWFSNRARSMLENTVQVARASYDREVERVANETVTMSGDLAGYLQQIAIDDPRFAEAFRLSQVLNRNLSEAIIFTYGRRQADPHACAGQPLRPAARQGHHARQASTQLKTQPVVPINSTDRIGALTPTQLWPQHLSLRCARVRSRSSEADSAARTTSFAITRRCSSARGSTSSASTPRCCSAR